MAKKGFNKFGAKKVIIDGIKFDSIQEGERYKDLVLMQKAGEISDLKLQVPFEIRVNGLKICKYIADFTYIDHNKSNELFREKGENGVYVVEDSKGFITPEFRLKYKLMSAVHGVNILLSGQSHNKPKRRKTKQKLKQ